MACRRLIDDELTPIVKVVSRNKLRNQHILTKDVDRLFLANEETMMYTFEKFATG